MHAERLVLAVFGTPSETRTTVMGNLLGHFGSLSRAADVRSACSLQGDPSDLRALARTTPEILRYWRQASSNCQGQPSPHRYRNRRQHPPARDSRYSSERFPSLYWRKASSRFFCYRSHITSRHKSLVGCIFFTLQDLVQKLSQAAHSLLYPKFISSYRSASDCLFDDWIATVLVLISTIRKISVTTTANAETISAMLAQFESFWFILVLETTGELGF